MEKTTLIASDIHLGCKYNNKSSFLNLLKHEKFDRLILNGDFIDGWRIKKHGLKYLSNVDLKIIKKIISISKNKEVIIIRGNHDDFLDDWIDTSIENIRIVDKWIEDGILIIHGDYFDAFTVLGNGVWAKLGDVGYNLLLRINWIFKFKRYSLSKKVKEKVKRIASFIGKFEYAACYMANENECHTVICGHIHTPDDKFIQIHDRKIRYLNSGDWQEGHSYIIINDKDIKLVNSFVDK